MVDEYERGTAGTAVANLQSAGSTWQARPSSSMNSPPRLAGYAGTETSGWDCNGEGQNTDEALFDDTADGNSFDFYVGIASAIGLLLVLIVALVTAASIWLLILR
jgi:hypothetical protein